MAHITLEAGQAEIDEAQSLQFKTPFLSKLLAGGLAPTDAFDMHVLASALRKARAYNAAMTRFGGSLLGIEFKSANREAYACVLPEPNGQGYRVLYFTADGFSGHHCEPTQSQAEVFMITEGYVEPTPGSLDSLSATAQWARGMAYADLITLMNNKRIDYAELARRTAELNAQFDAKQLDLACA